MDREVIKNIAKKIAETEPRKQLDIKNDIINWSYYNNTPNKKKYEYLIQKGDARLPMYTVHIPCQRPICDTLISQQAMRTWQFSVIATDKESVYSKWEAKQKAYLNAYMEMYEQKIEEYEDNVFMIQMQMQQIEDMLQQEPQTEEEAQQIMQLREQFPMIRRQFDKILKQFYKEIGLTEKTKSDIEHYYSYTYKDLREMIAEKLMINMRRDYEVKSKSIENMKQNVVIGKEAYLVYCNEKTNELHYDVLDRINVKYPIIKGVKYIQDSPWVSVVDTLSIESVKTMYGEELKELGVDIEKEIEDNRSATVNGSFVSVAGHGAIFTGNLNDSSNIYREDGIQRERIWFKKTKEVKFRVTKNMKEDAMVKHFVHMIPIGKTLLDKNKYKYTKVVIEGKEYEYYVNKNDKKDIYNVADCELYDTKKEKIMTRYTMDRYSCTIINNMWVVDITRDNKIVRNTNKHSKFCLPVFGKTYNSITDQPYSLIKNTIDLQDLYNAIYMLRQLAYAIAGAKGQIIDKSQKPEGMSNDEWEANMAQGRMYIQTIDASGRKVNNSFNQWNSFDNTVSSSVQYYDNVLMQIKETMGEIVGVPRQRLGELVKGDLVGNTEIALQQAHLITAMLYEEHDEVEAKALNELLMLYIKYQPIDNTFLEFNDRTEGRDIFFLEQDMFKDIDLELVVANSNKEQLNLEMFKQILQAEYSKGSISANDLAELIPIESITEMKKKTEYIVKRNQELAMQNHNQALQEQKEAQKEIEQFKAELQMQAQQHANIIAEKQLEIASFIAQSKAETEQQNILMQQYIEDNKHKREMLKIANEDKVEMSYLQEQSRSSTVQQRLSALQIQLDAMFNALKYGLEKKGLDLENMRGLKKINSTENKVPAMPKKKPENISDK